MNAKDTKTVLLAHAIVIAIVPEPRPTPKAQRERTVREFQQRVKVQPIRRSA